MRGRMENRRNRERAVAEALENRRLLAATISGVLNPLIVQENAEPDTIALADKFDDPAIAGTVVRFTDANLEAAVREGLHKPAGDITDGDMAGLASLVASGKGIERLDGLEYAVNLRSLYLGSGYDLQSGTWTYNHISDISPLAGLTQLTQLYLWSNQISDIRPNAVALSCQGLSM